MVNVAHHPQVAILDELRARDTVHRGASAQARMRRQPRDMRLSFLPVLDVKTLNHSAPPAEEQVCLGCPSRVRARERKTLKRMLFNATQAEDLRVPLVDGQKHVDLDIENPGQEHRKS